MTAIANGIASDIWLTLRRALYFGLSLSLVLSTAHHAHAVSTTGSSSGQSSPDLVTVIFVVVGIILSILYIRAMYLVLSYASKTYGLQENHTSTPESKSSNNLLILASALLVVGSALIISSYGLGSHFLYIGPVLALLGPLVIIISMTVDLKRYRKQLSAHRLEQPSGLLPSDASIRRKEVETQSDR